MRLLNEAGMDADSYLSREDFVGVGIVAMQKQANRVDDVRAAFRYCALLNTWLEFLVLISN